MEVKLRWVLLIIFALTALSFFISTAGVFWPATFSFEVLGKNLAFDLSLRRGLDLQVLLDERLDVIAEGPEAELRERMDRAMRAYLHERQRRAALGDPGFPVRVEAVRVPDSLSLALAINEVHELPLSYGWN